MKKGPKMATRRKKLRMLRPASALGLEVKVLNRLLRKDEDVPDDAPGCGGLFTVCMIASAAGCI
jgi:hypothetical protein